MASVFHGRRCFNRRQFDGASAEHLIVAERARPRALRVLRPIFDFLQNQGDKLLSDLMLTPAVLNAYTRTDIRWTDSVSSSGPATLDLEQDETIGFIWLQQHSIPILNQEPIYIDNEQFGIISQYHQLLLIYVICIISLITPYRYTNSNSKTKAPSTPTVF